MNSINQTIRNVRHSSKALSKTISKAASIAVILGAGALTAVPSQAYTVYQLEQNYYAIVCQDGQIFSYSGGPGGIGIVGEALCEGHGGIAGGGGTGVTVAKATAEIKRAAQSCKRGRELDKSSTKCAGKIRVNRWETSRQAR